MPHILSGVEVRNIKLEALKARFEGFPAKPTLVIIQIGNRPDSTAYVSTKIAFGAKIGAIVRRVHFPEHVTNEEIMKTIEECNTDRSVAGIIVQLPLLAHLDQEKIIEVIDPSKDVDGLTSTNVALLDKNNSHAIVPATARGVIELLDFYKIPIEGKKCTVVGRSTLVGRPIAQLLLNKGALVNVAHSKTVDVAKETRAADVIIVAVGKPGLIGPDHVRAGQVIIDVGINVASKLVGDVDFDKVAPILGSSGAISPVPGGVGPMTVFCLFENLADACDRMNV
jgi:methylenetetrahydrofolate dehydrogenase (NADP+)/methenyltetrahydrofolate cyclohydrolase